MSIFEVFGPTKIEDGTTVSSGGGTETTSTIELEKFTDLTIKVEGDSNTQDLDVILQGKLDRSNVFARHGAHTTQDLSSDVNNSRSFEFSCGELVEGRIKLKNDHSSNTTLTVREARSSTAIQ